MDIRIVQREDIDKVKWNSCVHYAEKGNPFGYLWFLDNISKDWFGIVEDDYHSVMPVFRSKNFWGSTKFTSPELLPFFQLYSVNVLSFKRVKAFMQTALNEVSGLNIKNAFVGFLEPQDTQIKQQNNTIDILNLGSKYTSLLNDFSKELQQIEHNIELDKYTLNSIKIEETAEFMAKQHRLKDKDKYSLMRLFYNAQQRQLGQVFALQDTDQTILGLDFYFFSHGKMISFLPSFNKKGKEINAEGIIFTRLLKRFAGKPLKYYKHPKSTLSSNFSKASVPITVYDLKK
jgi:hypothetical protein